jgi:ATP-dependent 26S proteasome regulatory subunit
MSSLSRFLIEGGRRLSQQARLNQVESSLTAPKLREAGFDRENIDYLISKLNDKKGPPPEWKMREELIGDFLGVEQIDTCIVKREWAPFWQPMLPFGYARIAEAYTEVDWPRKHKWGRALAGDFMPMYEDVETGYQKVANVISKTTGFLTTKEGIPFVATSDLRGNAWSDPNIVVQIERKHKKLADAFLNQIDQWVQAANIYKDQLLSYESNHLKFIKVPACSWDDVILPQSIIKQVRRATVDMLKRRAVFYDVGIGVRRSILMYGAPGIGKTQVGRALSNEVYADADTRVTIIWVSTKSINGARDIKGLYSAARTLAPTMLLLEDVDLIGKSRGESGPDYLLGELLTQMDGAEDNRGLITVATTNDLKKIDYALTKRPGRFDRLLPIPIPSKEARASMLRRFTKARKAILAEGVDAGPGSAWDMIITETEGMTGAYLQELINSAVIESVNSDSIEDGKPVLTDAALAEGLQLVRESFDRGPHSLLKGAESQGELKGEPLTPAASVLLSKEIKKAKKRAASARRKVRRRKAS